MPTTIDLRVRPVCDEREDGDARRILVDRIWPREMTMAEADLAWPRPIAPSTALPNCCGHDPKGFESARRSRAGLDAPKMTAGVRRFTDRAQASSPPPAPGDRSLRSSGEPREKMNMNPMLGLPERVRACLFDLDGVLTKTAKVHAAAWKEMFDAYLKTRAERSGEPFVAFDKNVDYDTYVDGKTRTDGTRSFLQSRHIDLPDGARGDRAGMETVNGLGNAKNEIVLRRIREDGVEAYEGSVRYVLAARAAGLHRAVVSSSANCAAVLEAAGIVELFETRIDGVTVASDHLAGKPAPDTFLAAARALGVDPDQAAVFEDALSGVEAGRAGGFGFVVGVDRVGQAEALRTHGADIVVCDLAELLDRP